MDGPNQTPQGSQQGPAETDSGGTSPNPQKRTPAMALIAFGIPALLGIVGIVAVFAWLRVKPELPNSTADVPRVTPEAQPDATPTNQVGNAGAIPSQATSQPGQGGSFAPPPYGSGASATSQGSSQSMPGMPSPGTPGSIPRPGRRASSPASEPSAPTAPNLPGLWPGYRGPRLDNVSTETGLAKSWPSGGPRKLWSVQLGEGYAGAAVRNGRVYILDYDQQNQSDVLRCFSLADGKQLWAQGYPVQVKRNHGMSRTVPAVNDKYVVTIGPKCHVMCTDAAAGTVYWKKDLVKEYGTKVPTWYAGQCPILDGNKTILAPGGKALMIAVDLATGKVVWQTPNPRGWEMTHSSIVPTSIGGKKVYLYCASGGVAAVSAADGSILWDTTDWTVSTANIPVPIPIGDGRVFLCGGYNAGAMMIRLKASGAKLTHEVLYRLKSKEFGSDQQSPILYQNHIYGVVPSQELVCMDLNGKRKWASGRTNRYALGPFMIADGMVYALSADGRLDLVKAAPDSFSLLSSAKILSGRDAWAPLAMAGGRLLARDDTTMVCLDVKGS